MKVCVINYKTYSQGQGKKGFQLAEILKRKIPKHIKLILCPQTCDIRLIKPLKISLCAQHCDPFLPGKYTGFQSIPALKEAGADYCLMNHAEHQVSFEQIKKTITYAKKNKLKTIVCVKNSAAAKHISKFKPDYIAFEPPGLIGGNKSVATKPELIKKIIKETAQYKIPLLVGAGIKTKQDVKKAFSLGASGILVSSGIMKAKDPGKKLKELFS